MVEGKLSTADELSAIAAASGKVQTKRIAAYIKTTYLDAGITDKQAIFERLHVSFSSMQPQSDR
jgi:DNA-binding transcriptional regulator LsrR (DeoR family)